VFRIRQKKLERQWEADGGTTGWVCLEKIPVAYYNIGDTQKMDAKELVRHLYEKVKVKEIHMLTGDSEGAALKVSREIGIPDECVHSTLTPVDKATMMKTFKGKIEEESRADKSCPGRICRKNRYLAMVGDGVNDGPALAEAHIGVAVAGSDNLAMETADVILMDENLMRLVWLTELAQDVRGKISQNVAISMVSKYVILITVVFAEGSLYLAIATVFVAMFLVSLNSRRLLYADEAAHEEGHAEGKQVDADDRNADAHQDVGQDEKVPNEEKSDDLEYAEIGEEGKG